MKYNIRANVKEDWNHPNCKFQPNDIVKCDYTYSYDSMVVQSCSNRIGCVVAVTCTEDGNIRGPSKYGYPRCFTRYYVKFNHLDKPVGIQSHQLSLVQDNFYYINPIEGGE